MNVKKIRQEGIETVALVTGTNSTWINAIRRTVMTAVPSLIIENVSIYKNDSVLFDEYLASRLGSLPLKRSKGYKKGEKVKLFLHVKGPKTVYAGDIQSKDPGVEVINKETPLTKLKENQELKLEMEAIMDVGKENVKWQPALISFKELPEIKNNVMKVKNAVAIAENCPKKVLEVKAGKVVLKNPYDCNLCGYCEEQSNGQIELSPSNSSFVVSLDSFGHRPAKEILSEAADLLKEKSAEFQKEVLAKSK